MKGEIKLKPISEMTDREIFFYCLHIQDIPALAMRMTEDRWIAQYCIDIRCNKKLVRKIEDKDWIIYISKIRGLKRGLK